MFYLLRLVYTLFIILTLPAIYIRLLLRSIKLPAYRTRMLERLGVYPKPNFSVKNIQPRGIWIHAVSVGEVVAAVPLIKALQELHPYSQITVTTTTPTGAQRVQQTFGSKVQHFYMPYDIPFCIVGLILKLHPSCLIIMETELWPNLLQTCYSRGIPVIIANARLSDSSFPRYKLFSWFFKKMLQQVTFVAAQSDLDSERFIQLGLSTNKILTVGNLKFEVKIDSSQLQAGKKLKSELDSRLILVAASTHVGEEQKVLSAFKQLQLQYPNSLLILVPRHPDRFNQVAEMLTQQQIKFVRRSNNSDICTSDTMVLLGDTMGELYTYYAAADIAFVGGSLVPVGGHNLLEPASLGVPCITGPYLENFKDIAKLLKDAGLLIIVQNEIELAKQCVAWFGSKDVCAKLRDKTTQIMLQNTGATNKILGIIENVLGNSTG